MNMKYVIFFLVIILIAVEFIGFYAKDKQIQELREQLGDMRYDLEVGGYATKEYCVRTAMNMNSSTIKNSLEYYNNEAIVRIKEKNDKRYHVLNDKIDKINENIRELRLITEVIRDCKN